MEKVFEFVSTLTPAFIGLFGFPTLEIYSDYVDVKFTSNHVVKNIEILMVPCDEFRLYPNEKFGINYVFTFYKS